MEHKVPTTKQERRSHAFITLQNKIASLEAENKELKEALAYLLKAVPVDVLRMKAGNGYLNMDLVESAVDKARALLEK